MLKLYRALEDVVTPDKTSGTEKAKCAEVAANIAIDVLKMESESIRAVIEIISKNNNNNTNKEQRRGLANLSSSQSKNDDESDNIEKEYNPNRKF